MSGKPTFFEGVEVHNTDLQLEVNTRISEDNTRLLDSSWTMGVVSGLSLSINGSTNTLVDLGVGHGYAPNGEYIENDASILGIALADYTASTTNLVIMMYTEVASAPRSHETLGTALNTVISRSFRLRVLTNAQYNALPTSNADLTQDALDRALIVGAVVANGVGVALTLDSITRASDLLWTANPVDIENITSPLTITGVEFAGAVGNSGSSTSTLPPLGNGSLVLVTSSSPPTLQWQAPGDAVGGTVNITGPGLFTLISGAPSFSHLVVLASPELFPTSGTYTNTINLSQDIYFILTGNPEMLSSEDRVHRATIGSVAASVANPHGIRGSDISSVLRVAQGIIAGSGMPDDTAHALIPRRTIHRANAGGGVTAIDLIDKGISTINARTYSIASGGPSAQYAVTSNAKWNGSAWAKDVNGQPAFIFFVFGAGFGLQSRLAANNAAWTTWDQILIASNATASITGPYMDGPLTIGFDTSGDFTSNVPSAILPRRVENIDSTIASRWEISEETDLHGGTPNGAARWYAFGGAGVSPSKELVMGASWNGTHWVRDNATGLAVKIVFSSDPATGGTRGIFIYTYDVSGGSPFADASFVEGWYLSANPLTEGASRHTNGRLSFGTTGVLPDFGNPVTTTGFTNTLMAKNVCKAWGVVSISGGAPVLQNGFNVTSAITNGGGNGITITLATGTTGSSGCPVATLYCPAASSAGGANAIGVTISALSPTTFDLNIQNDIGLAIPIAGGNLNNYSVFFQVMGIQD